MTSAAVDGVAVLFNGMYRASFIFMIYTHRASAETVTRLSARLQSLRWGTTFVGDDFIQIQRKLDFKGGKTVRQLVAEVEAFADGIQKLALPNQDAARGTVHRL